MPGSRRWLEGRVALVTGASRGIGRAIAQRLASAGATVVVSARSLRAPVRDTGTLLETVARIEANGDRALALAADLMRPDERDVLVSRAIEAAGRLDILVNNAGYAEYEATERTDDALFARIVGGYLHAPFALARAAIPHFRARGSGWIVNVGSVTALPPLRPYAGFDRHAGATLYASVKAAVARFTQGLAAELLEHGIAVNQISPSTGIRTEGSSHYIPEDYPTEDPAYLPECALQLCLRPAAERTGLVTYSMHLPGALGFPVYSLDGRRELPPPVLPPHSHPGIVADGTGS